MESFFQAAACALDKVLDDFEQTEDDVDYFGLVPAARGSEMFTSQDGTRRAGLAAPEPVPPSPRPPPLGTDALSEKRSSLPALILPPLAPLVDGQGGERDRPFLSLPSNFIAEKPGSPTSQSFSSSASSVESPLPSPSFPKHPPAASPGAPASPLENLPSTLPPSPVASPWASLPTDDTRGTAPIDPFATTRRSDFDDALDVGLVSPVVTLSDETVTPSPPRSSQQPQFTRHFEAARLQDCLAAGGGEDESAAHNACRPPLVTFDLLSAGPGAETLAPQRGPPLCDLLSGTHDKEQRPRDAIAADASPASDVDRTPFRGGRAEGGETNGDGSCSTSVGNEQLAVVCVADEPRSPDRDLSDETWRNSAAEMSSENDASAMFEAESVRADASRDDSPEPPLCAEALAATGVEMFAEGSEFDDADRSCGEKSGGGIAINQPTALDDCRRGVDSEAASEPPGEPPAGDSLQHWPPISGDGADVVRPPLYRGAERETLPSLVNEEEVATPTLGTEELKKAREEFLEELEEREEEPGASVTVKEEEEEGTAPRTNGAADVSESDAELEAFLSSLEASADSPPASPAPSLKEDRVTEEKEVEDSKSDTSGDSVSPLRGGGADSGSPAMAPLLPRHAAPAHNGTDAPGAARPPPGGARPKQPLRRQLPRPASNLLGSRDEADGREPPEAHAAPSSATENHVAAMAPAEEGEDDEDEETTQEEEEEEERAWSHGPGGASRARAGGERPAGGTQGREGLGMSAPTWVPDAEAPKCMRCAARFTFTRRRHHCRACGKVFCAPCCSQKSRLRYMENKEARVCIRCHTHIDKAEAVDRMVALAPSPPPPAPPSPTSMSAPPSGSPNPNNPAEYCSTLPPLQQARAAGTLASPPPTVMVPVSALKHPGQDGSQREPRRVWFADGILPNGEVADATILSGTPGTPVPGSSPPPTPPPAAAAAAAQDPGLPVSLSEPEPLPPTVAPAVPVTAMVPAALAASLGPPAAPGGGPRVLPAPTGSPVGKGLNLIPDDDEGLPPILISSGVKGDYSVEERPSPGLLVAVLEEAETRGGGGADASPVVFVLNANLLVSLRIINYVNRRCWLFATRGMHAVGQAEVVVLLQCLPDEKTVPKDVFHSLLHVYTDAYKGKPVGHLGHSFLGRGFLGSREHGGFLFVSPAMQALPACELPPQPLLFALLIQKWEAPWAKVFPIRLMLRLGAEFRFYPCPLFSVRFRKPLFGETGHTIMNLLADFRNYQYSLPTVPGLVVSMEMGHTWIDIPSNRYNQMVKVLNGANEHVLAFGAVFNSAADSHLVCVQNDDGNYQTQAINIHATPRKVTGASFVVFNGALKSSSGFLAKSSIVEDGLMVQITAEGMEALRSALREMRDHTLVCGRADGEPPREHVHARWVADDAAFNRGVTSPIDGRSMEGVPSVKIFQGSEFKGSGKIIRWTEVFFLQKEEEGVGEGGSREGGTSTFDPADHSRVAEAVARAFCVALAPRLKELREDGLTQLGLRLTLHSEQVGYQAGGNGQPLPVQYMNELDCALIPIMHGGGGGGGPGDGAVRMELVFSIMENVS